MLGAEPGRWAVLIGFGASVLAFVAYCVGARGNASARRLGRILYALAALASALVFFRLMSLVAAKRFAYRYVFDYVSADLSGAYLYSATWAGQEGSFALWAFLTGLIGLLVAWRAKDWEAYVMPVYIVSLAVLFAVMHWQSPFELIPPPVGPRPPDVPATLPWPPPWPPQDGNGLNPALQNIWMAIHPPTIFLGFAALGVPYAYAIASLWRRVYAQWAAKLAPYVLLSATALGAGLFMGGYWAYETQGWHGFWAWDPVENASLFPWLVSLALVHGLIVQRATGGMARMNLILAVAGWLLFLYGTFLTRSGALANFSVHAYGMTANKALYLILALISVEALVGIGLLLARWRTIPSAGQSGGFLSTDTAIWFAVTTMAVAAALICLGTSWPLLSRWSWLHSVPGLSGVTGSEGVRVEPVFYNRLGAVLVIPTLFALGSVPFLAWGSTDADAFMRRMMLPWLLAIAGGTVVLWFVLHEAALGFQADTPRAVTVAIGTLGLFAAFANGMVAVKMAHRRMLRSGGWLAHCGVGLLLLGTIIANVYEKTESYAIVEGGEPIATAFGYTLGFAGWTHDGEPQDQVLRDWTRPDHAVLIRVGFPSRRAYGRGYIARVAVFKYWDAASSGWRTMTWPDIHRQIHRDIYLAAADDPKLIRPSATLRPGETATIGTAGMPPTGYSVRYNRFLGSGHGRGMSSLMGADMTLVTPDKRAIHIRPGISFSEGSPTPVNVAIPEIGGAAVLEGGISPGSKELTVAFELPGAPARWVVPVAATNKPLIGLVWLGATLIVLGSALAMALRAIEMRKPSPTDTGQK